MGFLRFTPKVAKFIGKGVDSDLRDVFLLLGFGQAAHEIETGLIGEGRVTLIGILVEEEGDHEGKSSCKIYHDAPESESRVLVSSNGAHFPHQIEEARIFLVDGTGVLGFDQSLLTIHQIYLLPTKNIGIELREIFNEKYQIDEATQAKFILM